MQKSLLAGVSSLQWIVDGYMLAFAGLLLVGGTLGDLFGRKKVMLGGVALFCVGSLIGALANDTSTLIAGRVVMGVGAAACEPGTLSLIRQIYREERARARALGVWTSVSGVSLAAGPGARRPSRRGVGLARRLLVQPRLRARGARRRRVGAPRELRSPRAGRSTSPASSRALSQSPPSPSP